MDFIFGTLRIHNTSKSSLRLLISVLYFALQTSAMPIWRSKFHFSYWILRLRLRWSRIQLPTSHVRPNLVMRGLNIPWDVPFFKPLSSAWIGIKVGKWFLAQAPGPNTRSTPDTALFPSSFSDSSSASKEWSDSWDGHWKPLPETINSSSGFKPSATRDIETSKTARATDVATGGLTTEAKVGLGIGMGSAALVIILIAALLVIRRRHRERRVKAGTSKHDQPNVIYEAPDQEPRELDTNDGLAHELPGNGRIHSWSSNTHM